MARHYLIDADKQHVFGEDVFTLIEHPTSANDAPRSEPSYTQLAIAPGES